MEKNQGILSLELSDLVSKTRILQTHYLLETLIFIRGHANYQAKSESSFEVKKVYLYYDKKCKLEEKTLTHGNSLHNEIVLNWPYAMH